MPVARIAPEAQAHLTLDLYHARLQAVTCEARILGLAAFNASVIDRLDQAGVQAWLLDVPLGPSPLAVIEGTNDWCDWAVYNFDAASARHAGHRWHSGFLRYGLAVMGWLSGKGAKHVIGHSLGGAAAQIVSQLTLTPATTFGAPPVLAEPEPMPIPTPARNHIRIDDTVTHLPYWARHIGDRVVWQPHRWHRGSDHGIESAYIPVLSGRESADALWNPGGTQAISAPPPPATMPIAGG